jgi:hypothetical protein
MEERSHRRMQENRHPIVIFPDQNPSSAALLVLPSIPAISRLVVTSYALVVSS